ncbi:hypothetical protein C4D60_Mb09t23480 [Musa balbisiana]|uniref:Dynein light chain n=1 Tax=Musa balbisiana TaxID=52838 RepID=A0A4V4H3H1_MUSBA|nr:hypothetical protein C4D60_Mb09t23480 [Musa balbisiana]
MRGAAKKAASEELELRSQYLSSLVQRTKIMGDNAAAAADHDKKEVVEATAAKPERREQLRQCSQQRMQEKEVVEEGREKKKGVGDGDRCVGDVRDPPRGQQQQQKEEEMNVKVRAADMSLALQKHAFRCARETLTSMPKLESKRLALALKKARPRPSMPSFPYRKVVNNKTLKQSSSFQPDIAMKLNLMVHGRQSETPNNDITEMVKEFDSTYGPAWHCIVGTSFGSYVTHSLGGFLYFSIDKVYILLFRTAVEPYYYIFFKSTRLNVLGVKAF